MAQIGSFTRGENGIYTGEIRTLTLRVKATIRPVERENDKAPDHRVNAGGVEFGAGWTKAARETGAEYLSLKLDDPSFPAPIYATLTLGDLGYHLLFWSFFPGSPAPGGAGPSRLGVSNFSSSFPTLFTRCRPLHVQCRGPRSRGRLASG